MSQNDLAKDQQWTVVSDWDSMKIAVANLTDDLQQQGYQIKRIDGGDRITITINKNMKDVAELEIEATAET